MDNRPNSKAKVVVGAACSLHHLRHSRFTATQVARYGKVSYNTARKWLDRLSDVGDINKHTTAIDYGAVQSVTVYWFDDDQRAIDVCVLWNVENFVYQHNLWQ